jgi:hypothetical protein
MKKYRKMLSDINAPYLQSIMRAIETQSKATLVNWSVGYAHDSILPIYAKIFPCDDKPSNALKAARDWMEKKIKLPEAKTAILECHTAARELDNIEDEKFFDAIPAAQAAARAIGQAAATIHAPTHSLGLALYGALAAAYDKLGGGADWNLLLEASAIECANMEAALRQISLENEPNPAKINWKC